MPWWGPDLQTLRDTIRPQRLPQDRSTELRIDIGAGEALLARYSRPQAQQPAALVVVIPGLGGCSEGPGIRRLADHLLASGFAVLRLNMRGAGAGRSLASGTYAALCNRDLLPALIRARQLADQLTVDAGSTAGRPVPLFGIGLSLGGTILLNGVLQRPAPRSLLAQEPPLAWPAQSLLDGLVCVSSPLDLIRCTEQFDRPRNRVYRRWVLRRLRQLTLDDPRDVAPQERSALTGPARVRTLQAFDARITAPRWGFGSVSAYYQAASPLDPLLAAIAAGVSLPPILLIHAADDPWVPVAATRQLASQAKQQACAWLETLITAHGGHNGFHGPEDDGRTSSWADRQAVEWIRSRLLSSGTHPGSGNKNPLAKVAVGS